MIRRYKKSIIQLINCLHNHRNDPLRDIDKWLILQMDLIKKIIYVENRIRLSKNNITEINKLLKSPLTRLPRIESTSLKEKLKRIKYSIEEYKRIILIYKSIGDGIAFTFLHKLDIKPQNFKESSGFISDKTGLKNEIIVLKNAYKQGIIAIFNDTTSVLKYADILLITNDGIIPIEVKSSNSINKRILRQKHHQDKLFQYLSEDVSENFIIPDQIVQRISMASQEVNYISKFNFLLNLAEKKGIASLLFEKGMLCIIAYNTYKDIDIPNTLHSNGLRKPYAFHLNKYKFTGQGYYPFSLSFNKANHYWDFLEGKINIFIFINFSTIEYLTKKRGFSVEKSNELTWAFTFKNQVSELPLSEMKMSDHYFFRAIMEFVSVKWLINDSFDRLIK